RRGGDDTSLRWASDQHGPPSERGIVALLDGREEGVHVDMQDLPHPRIVRRTSTRARVNLLRSRRREWSVRRLRNGRGPEQRRPIALGWTTEEPRRNRREERAERIVEPAMLDPSRAHGLPLELVQSHRQNGALNEDADASFAKRSQEEPIIP